MQIEITKNGKKVEVSKTAFDNFFKNHGWVECKNSAQPVSNKKEVNKVEEIEEDWGEIESDEDIEKPLSEMNRNELLALAEKLGVDVSGLSKNSQLRDAIKAAM